MIPKVNQRVWHVFYSTHIRTNRNYMNRVSIAVALESLALLIFTVICSPAVSVPIGFLILFLLALQIGLLWMVVTILKHGVPSHNTFEEKFYEDKDF
jgi:hypothetical protein